MFYRYPPESGRYVLGVPARDLSDAEFEALSPEDQALVSALYVPEQGDPPSAPENPAPADTENK